MKCNYQHPCGRCTARNVVCEFTRPGYEDPYKQYGIGSDSVAAAGEEKSTFIISNLDESPSAADLSQNGSSQASGENAQVSGTSQSETALGDVGGTAFLSHGRAQDPASTGVLENPDCPNLNFAPMDFDFWPMWDWDTSQDFQPQLDEAVVTVNEGRPRGKEADIRRSRTT